MLHLIKKLDNLKGEDFQAYSITHITKDYDLLFNSDPTQKRCDSNILNLFGEFSSVFKDKLPSKQLERRKLDHNIETISGP